MADLRLYRFDKREHICDLAQRGELFLSPASKYADETLAPGAYDPSELRLEQRLPTGVRFEAFDGKTGKSKGYIEPLGTGPLTANLESNYYVFCMSYHYEESMYEEFRADSCLIITDPDRFINQACKAIREALPGWFVDAGTVRYRSPEAFYSMYPTNHDVRYGKKAEYEHQREIRIVCAPPEAISQLEPTIVNIGNLYGYTYISGLEDPTTMIESECIFRPIVNIHSGRT